MTVYGDLIISDKVLYYLRTQHPYIEDEDILNLFIEGCNNFNHWPQDFVDTLEKNLL